MVDEEEIDDLFDEEETEETSDEPEVIILTQGEETVEIPLIDMIDEPDEEETEGEPIDDLFDDDDVPDPSVQKESETEITEVLEEKYKKAHEEPQGTIIPDKVVEIAEEVGGTEEEAVTVELILGNAQAAALMTIAESNNRPFDSMVELESLPEIGHIEVSENKNGSAAFITVYSPQGNDITDSIATAMDLPPELMTTIKGTTAIQFDSVIENSAFTGADGDSPRPYNADQMGASFKNTFATFTDTADQLKRRTEIAETLLNLRSLMGQLSQVFAFDDYRHLESFIAAWMMQDSTCRLSGIPGTGKTTVIECASTLLSNSYGFNTAERICVPKDYKLTGNIEEIFQENAATSNIYETVVFPTGQQYHISYGNIARRDIKNLWEVWRFSEWEPPKLDASQNYVYTGNTAGGDNAAQGSGGYTYDFSYLQNEYATRNLSQQYNKIGLKSDSFRMMLLNHYYVDVPVHYDIEIKDTHNIPVEKGIPIVAGRTATKRLVKPVKLFDADGKREHIPSYIELPNGKEEAIKMQLRYPEALKDYTAAFAEIEARGRSVSDAVKQIIEESHIPKEVAGIYTDAGRNEGYWFREFLTRNFYDSRAESETPNYDDIANEMIAEIGIAKIDFEKRADEVLYGMEIRETSTYDAITGSDVNTFDFEPIPRPIVTQPIKFFNEANRSKAGMEDAILGLIAERKVEYRGKEFDSPNFVAWMDTNPHQKGNDLAFTDRIDMELLFKSVSMGGRYAILSQKAELPPKLVLVKQLTQRNAKKPLRFKDLRHIWYFIQKDIQLVQPGGAYDGYRDISAISVLFSQAYRKRLRATGVNKKNASWIDNPHESPLVDYSITTNTESGGAGEAVKSPVMDEEAAKKGWAEDISGFDTAAATLHVPAMFKRILGFRFTNSLMKLSRALAFLRGKLYVSREDIVDALPYVTAHRMGRSREGLSDYEGNTKGIDKTVAKKLAYNNEQEFIRDVLVNGYIMRKIDVGQSTGASLLEMLDSFYERCVSILQSSNAAWEYEEQVLWELQNRIITKDDLAPALSPVHWHIATMVSESERNGYIDPPLRHYNYPENNTKGYPEMYNYFLQRITQPVSDIVKDGDAGVIDYYILRGEVANNINLFSDDKSRLLRLIDEEIGVVASTGTGLGTAFPESAADDITKTGTRANRTTDELDRFSTRSYGDPLGAWGAVSGMTSDAALQLTHMTSIWSNLNVATANFYTAASAPAVENMVSRLSGQQLKVIGRFPVGTVIGNTGDYDKFMQSMHNFMGVVSGWVGRGRLITDANMTESYKDVVKNKITDYPSEPVGFGDFMRICKEVVKETIKDPTIGAEYDILDRNNKKVTRVATMSGLKGQTGLMACFELPHAIISKFKPDTRENDLGEPLYRSTDLTKRSMKAGDHLRLWIKLSTLGDVETTATGGQYNTYIFTIGITSNFGIWMDDLGGAGKSKYNETIEWCAIDFEPGYMNKFWKNQSAQQLYTDNASKATLVDAGNMTKADRQYYGVHIGNALLRNE